MATFFLNSVLAICFSSDVTLWHIYCGPAVLPQTLRQPLIYFYSSYYIYAFIIYPVCHDKPHCKLCHLTKTFQEHHLPGLNKCSTIVKCTVLQKIKTVRSTENRKLCTCMCHNTTAAALIVIHNKSALQLRWCATKIVLHKLGSAINIPTMEFFTGISRNSKSKSFYAIIY